MPRNSLASRLARGLEGRDTSPVDRLSLVVIFLFCVGMLLVPWERLFGASFVDRSVYINKFTDFHAKPRSVAAGIISFVTNEVLWDMSVRWFANQYSIEILFAAISFLCIFVFAKYLVSRHGLVSLVLLVNPLIIVFAFSQLRMALAVSLLMLAYFRREQWLLVALLLPIACCIHTATFLVLFMYFAARVLVWQLSEKNSSGFFHWGCLLIVALLVVIVVGPLRVKLLTLIGDRRVVYETGAESIRYASFWILLLFVTATQNRRYFENEGNAVAVVFLAVFVFGSFLNVYNARFLSAAYPLIISAILSLGVQKRALILPIYLLYVSVQWYYWLTSGA